MIYICSGYCFFFFTFEMHSHWVIYVVRKDFDKLSSNLERIDVINLRVREENAEREEFVNKSVLQENIKNQMPKCGAVAYLK